MEVYLLCTETVHIPNRCLRGFIEATYEAHATYESFFSADTATALHYLIKYQGPSFNWSQWAAQQLADQYPYEGNVTLDLESGRCMTLPPKIIMTILDH